MKSLIISTLVACLLGAALPQQGHCRDGVLPLRGDGTWPVRRGWYRYRGREVIRYRGSGSLPLGVGTIPLKSGPCAGGQCTPAPTPAPVPDCDKQQDCGDSCETDKPKCCKPGKGCAHKSVAQALCEQKAAHMAWVGRCYHPGWGFGGGSFEGVGCSSGPNPPTCTPRGHRALLGDAISYSHKTRMWYRCRIWR